MPRSPDFFRSLNEQLLEQLEEYTRQPGVTGDEVCDWLAKQGVQASRSAVYRWRQDFLLEDRTQRASEAAKGYLAAVRESDPQAVTEASLRKFEELVFDTLTTGDELSTGDLLKIAMAMKAGLGSRKEVIELKKLGTEALAKLKTESTRRAITPADIDAVSKAVFGS